MSSEPRNLTCHEALNYLYEFLDQELTPQVEIQVRHHLAACAPCTSRFGFEETFLKFLEARSRARGAPPELKRRILEHLFLDPNPPEQ